jgi:hypothetical protein
MESCEVEEKRRETARTDSGSRNHLGPGSVEAMLGLLPQLIVVFVLLAAPSYTFIPAVNSTAQGVAGSEDSTINLKWPSGTFQETISYQLAANSSQGISKVCPS